MYGQIPLIDVANRIILPLREEIEIYHDEIKDSNNNPVAHSFLCVPTRSKNILLNDLLWARNKRRVNNYKLNFKYLSGAKFNRQYECTRDWLMCLINGMANKKYTSIRNFINFPALGLRYFAIFMPSLNRLSDDYFKWCSDSEKIIRKFETLMRIGLKGGLHYLYSSGYKVRIMRFVTDSYAFHRELDSKRIIKRLEAEKESYVEFAHNLKIESLESDHRKKSCNDMIAAHLLQLSDLMLGSISFCCIKNNHLIKEVVVKKVKELLDKRKRGRNFIKSSHYKTYAITICNIENNNWTFKNLENKIVENISQMKLQLDINDK